MDHGKNDLATLSESVASISKGRFLPELGSSETTKCGGTKNSWFSSFLILTSVETFYNLKTSVRYIT